jgi:hypothetical protein
MLAMLACAVCLTAAPDLLPHPFVAVDRATLEKAWDRGYADGAKRKDANAIKRRFERKLDESSTVELLYPQLTAYMAGFQTRRSGVQGSNTGESRKSTVDGTLAATRTLAFEAHMIVEPKVDGPLRLPGDPKSLTGISVELQVSGRTYAPSKQPGDLAVRTETVTEKVEVPLPPFSPQPKNRRDPIEVHRDRPEDLPGIDKETRKDAGFGRHQRTRVYQVLKGDFTAGFDLYNADGTPRITERDTEIRIVVSGRFGQQSVIYKLADIGRALR